MTEKPEPVTENGEKTEKETSSFRLFGQFKPNGTGFSQFGQLSSNGENSPSTTTTSYFTSTLSKLTPTNGGGFGSSSSSLAASLAPLSSNATTLFGASNSLSTVKTTTTNNAEEEDDEDGDDDEDEEETTENKSTPSLLETAAEYEAKRASTHPSANIQGDTSTGEEHEVTKFQMAGKLYMYSPEQHQYVERGYGILKINESHDPSDWDKLHARLIMRLDKAFRVILNSPIFPKMTVERASDRSVRFGAQDDYQLRIFTIKASTNDCTNLCKELQSRIQIIEGQQIPSPTKTNANPSDSSSTETLATRIRKRSHSGSNSNSSEHTNDLSKRSKVTEGYHDPTHDTSDDDSVESTKTGEQETTG